MISNLPAPGEVALHRIILSGGEPLVWPDLLLHSLDGLYARYGESTMIWLQTNGDLLDERMLRALMERHVQRIDIASQDRFHPRSSRERLPGLEEMLRDHGFVWAGALEDGGFAERPSHERVYHHWGASPDTWIGGRSGRAAGHADTESARLAWKTGFARDGVARSTFSISTPRAAK